MGASTPRASGLRHRAGTEHEGQTDRWPVQVQGKASLARPPCSAGGPGAAHPDGVNSAHEATKEQGVRPSEAHRRIP